MKKYTKKQILTQLWHLFLVVLGTVVLAVGTAVFVVPYDLVTGGMSGIAIVLHEVLPLDWGIDVYITLLTWGLFFLGLITLGRDFAMKTLVSTVVYPVAFSLSTLLVSPDVLGGFFYLQGTEYQQIAILLATVFGAVFVGAGCALTFLGGGSTGGTDILAFIVCKIFRKLKSSTVIFAIDALIVLAGVIVFRDLTVCLLGITSAFICAMMIDYVFIGGDKAFVAQIISPAYEEINRLVIEKMDRTTTITDVTGGYSGEGKKMVMLSFSRREYADVMQIINTADKEAFVTVCNAHEINGEGWTHGAPPNPKG